MRDSTGRMMLTAYTALLLLCASAALYLKKRTVSLALVLMAAVFAGFLIFVSFFSPYRVSGMSMYPTYAPGQILFTSPYEEPDDVSMGDVIVFYLDSASEYLVKRVEGLPGDTVDIQGGALVVNGEIREEGFEKMESTGSMSFPLKIGDGEFFVLGDNRNVSSDSRDFGPVPFSKIC